MQITIHRGSHQIGGNFVEIATASTRLILDVGLPLEDLGKRETTSAALPADPLVSQVFASTPAVSAVLLSHAHADHTGLVRLIPPGIPVYLSRGTSKMMNAGAIYANQPEVPREQERPLKPRSLLQIGDMTVTAYPVDHSAFDSQAFLIEADGQNVLYSGDLRLHGRKPGMARALLQAMADKSVDVLLMEGTNLSGARQPGPTEKELEDQILADIQSAPGLVLASFSPMHVDRLVTFYKATRRAQRILAVDHYAAYVLYLVSGQARIPRAGKSTGIHVFLPTNQKDVAKIRQCAVRAETTLETILADPKHHVMMFRPSMIDSDFAGKLPQGVRCLYSYWSGYLERPEWQNTQTRVKEAQGDFLTRHTSGHIHAEDIVKFVEALNPRQVIPIHTQAPEEFARIFPNALILNDGVAYPIKK
jgi:ribonuclease J